IEGCLPEFAAAENNLLYQTLTQVLAQHGRLAPNLRIFFDTDLPVCSGLGSSSTCIVAGVMAANIIGNLSMDTEQILRTATQIEGHPDNVAPAILGGFVAAIVEDGLVYWHRYPISDRVSFYAIMPEVRVPTEAARAALPKTYTLTDCIYNLSRVPILVEGLERADPRLIRAGCKDRIHQEYRLQLIPQGEEVMRFVTDETDAVAVYISGAGPTIVAVVIDDDDAFLKQINRFTSDLTLKWTTRKMHLQRQGAHVRLL
ncbi:MAG: homoserine kinase, partial [Kiritimatiellae bacterium]|nr:homoserine kinase [Kiritimatiellia bacterium]